MKHVSIEYEMIAVGTKRANEAAAIWRQSALRMQTRNTLNSQSSECPIKGILLFWVRVPTIR